MYIVVCLCMGGGGGSPRVWGTVPKVWTSVPKIWSFSRAWNGFPFYGRKLYIKYYVAKIMTEVKTKIPFEWCGPESLL